VTEQDCGTDNGLLMTPIIEGGDVVEPLRERILGRVSLPRRVSARHDEVLCEAGTCSTRSGWTKTLEEMGIDEVMVRSPITCETRHGICAQLRSRSRARPSGQHRRSVGVIAAQSIGEPGTQLTMRTFHIGGAASRASGSTISRSSAGVVRCTTSRPLSAQGNLVAVSRSGELSMLDKVGRERERYKLPYGASDSSQDGDRGRRLARSSPTGIRIPTRSSPKWRVR
jgi:DNA-directed RNA polymerase subunit beta'